MRGLAARGTEGPEALAGLGTSVLAVRAGARAVAPPGTAVVETADGVIWFAYPGVLRCVLAPFAAAPEFGLRLDYCFDPSGDQARFALLLAGEVEGLLAIGALAVAVQDAVRGALQTGSLDLPPCAADDEWQAFRAGLNELIYTRFGLVVEDCLPLDLHPVTDFARDLLASVDAGSAGPLPAAAAVQDAIGSGAPQEQIAMPLAAPAPAQAQAGQAQAGQAQGGQAQAGETGSAADARAMRRLFLELPALASGLRALPMREGDGSFAPMQDILRRLALAAVSANTMPSLHHAAPGKRLPEQVRRRRVAHSLAAQAALDEAWALLAAMRCGLDPGRLDDADRILSNLEYSLAQRRLASTGETP